MNDLYILIVMNRRARTCLWGDLPAGIRHLGLKLTGRVWIDGPDKTGKFSPDITYRTMPPELLFRVV